MPKNMPAQYLTNVRLVQALADAMEADPGARANRSAFVREVVSAFIAGGGRVEGTRVIGVRLSSKGSGRPMPLSAPVGVRDHWARYAASAGQTSSSLINSALAAHYFPLATMQRTTAACTEPVRECDWSRILRRLQIGQEVQYRCADLNDEVGRARTQVVAAADRLTRTCDQLRYTVRETPGGLWVGRL